MRKGVLRVYVVFCVLFVLVLICIVCAICPVYITHKGVLVFNEVDSVKSYFLCQPLFSEDGEFVDFEEYDCLSDTLNTKKLMFVNFGNNRDIEFGTNIIIEMRVADSVFEYVRNRFILWCNDVFCVSLNGDKYFYRLVDEVHNERVMLDLLSYDKVTIGSVLDDNVCVILRNNDLISSSFKKPFTRYEKLIDTWY